MRRVHRAGVRDVEAEPASGSSAKSAASCSGRWPDGLAAVHVLEHQAAAERRHAAGRRAVGVDDDRVDVRRQLSEQRPRAGLGQPQALRRRVHREVVEGQPRPPGQEGDEARSSRSLSAESSTANVETSQARRTSDAQSSRAAARSRSTRPADGGRPAPCTPAAGRRPVAGGRRARDPGRAGAREGHGGARYNGAVGR